MPVMALGWLGIHDLCLKLFRVYWGIKNYPCIVYLPYMWRFLLIRYGKMWLTCYQSHGFLWDIACVVFGIPLSNPPSAKTVIYLHIYHISPLTTTKCRVDIYIYIYQSHGTCMGMVDDFFGTCLRWLQEMDHATLITSTGLSSCTFDAERRCFCGFWDRWSSSWPWYFWCYLLYIFIYIGAYTTELYSDCY